MYIDEFLSKLISDLWAKFSLNDKTIYHLMIIYLDVLSRSLVDIILLELSHIIYPDYYNFLSIICTFINVVCFNSSRINLNKL